MAFESHLWTKCKKKLLNSFSLQRLNLVKTSPDSIPDLNNFQQNLLFCLHWISMSSRPSKLILPGVLFPFPWMKTSFNSANRAGPCQPSSAGELLDLTEYVQDL